MSRFAFALLTLVSLSAFASTARFSLDVQGTKTVGGKVDLLFVIDDSGSMDPHQRHLTDAIAKIAPAFENSSVDYHAAVITTSDSIGSSWGGSRQKGGDGLMVGGVISNQDPAFTSKLTALLNVGTQGEGIEKFFSPIAKALATPPRHPENANFLRPDAVLAIVILTDAEIQDETPTPNQFVNDLVALKGGQADLVKVIAAYIPSSAGTNAQCSRDDQSMPVRFDDFAKYSNATVINLCSATMGDEVAKAITALQAAPGTTVPTVIRDFKLPLAPKLSSMKVSFGSKTLVGGDSLRGWTYRSNTNVLHVGDLFDYSKEAAGTKLDVEFEY